MSILNVSTPTWVSEQQRTIIPRSALMQRQGSIGAPAPQQPQGAMPQQHDPRDKVPAMMREGEEVITPEVKAAVGGRQGMVEALNSKLKPKGLALKLNRPPVGQETTEQNMLHGTMDVQNGYARGTAQLQPQPTYYPGGIFTDMNTNNLGQNMPYNQKRVQQQHFCNGTMGVSYKGSRKGYAFGTIATSAPTTKAPAGSSYTTPTTSTASSTTIPTTISAGSTPTVTTTTGPTSPTGVNNPLNTVNANTAANTAKIAQEASQITSPYVNNQPNPLYVAPTPAASSTNLNNATAMVPADTTIPATTTPITNPVTSVSNAVKGIGYNVQPITQSAYYKTQEEAAREAIQKAGGVGAMQNAENLAQQGIGQSSAAGRTSAAEQAASTESNITQADTQLAQQAQAQAQTDLQNSIQIALSTGDWTSVNKDLAASGQQPIDFTNLEQARVQGNLMGVSNDLMSLSTQMASSNIPGAGALAQTLASQAMTMRVQAYNTVTGTSFDSSAIQAATSQLGSGDYSSPQAAAIVNVVYPVIESWANTDPSASTFFNDLAGNSAGEQLLAQVQAGNQQAISQLGTLTTLAFNMANQPQQMTASDIATLKKYGAYRDYSALLAAETAGQEPASMYPGKEATQVSGQAG